MAILNGISPIRAILNKIGIDTDLWTTKPTLMGYSNASYKHIHNPGYVTPSDGSVITATTGEGAFGAFVDVVAATIDRPFDIHWLSVTDIEANGVYVIELHRLDGGGASEELLCQVPCTRADNFSRVGEVFTQIPVQPANARIGARVRKGVAGEHFVKFIAHYHDYQ